MLFDTHAHYNDGRFDADRYEILDNMKKSNIGHIVNAADSMESIEKILPLCERYPFMYAAIGVHPENAADFTEGDVIKLTELSKNKKVCAIGEIGLDYYYDEPPRDTQKECFERQLELAIELGLPVVIHDREAHGDCMDILRKYVKKGLRGVMHCYSGSSEMAKELVSWGMYIGLGGTLTFKNAKKVREAAETVPLTNIVLETDCPYLAPEPHRGERNSSLLMHYVAEQLARIKGTDVAEIERATYENAKKLYGIED